MVTAHKNLTLQGPHGNIGYDVFSPTVKGVYPCIIYSHGFKGFKDWGHSDLLAKTIASKGYIFLKFNFSHNGIKGNNLSELTDLDAFANNNFSIELDDLGAVINLVDSAAFKDQYSVDHNEVYLMGHSRGGGISLLKVAEDARIKKIVTLGSVHSFRPWVAGAITKAWKEKGIYHAVNSRTGQKLPMLYQIVEDYEQNIERLCIEGVAPKINIPVLLLHGTEDAAVPIEAAKELAITNPLFILKIIDGENHVFGSKHPWTSTVLSNGYYTILPMIFDFLNGN